VNPRVAREYACIRCGAALRQQGNTRPTYCSADCRNRAAQERLRAVERPLTHAEIDRIVNDGDRKTWGILPPWEAHPVPWDCVRGKRR